VTRPGPAWWLVWCAVITVCVACWLAVVLVAVALWPR
jgi:hypothetical protein